MQIKLRTIQTLKNDRLNKLIIMQTNLNLLMINLKFFFHQNGNHFHVME